MAQVTLQQVRKEIARAFRDFGARLPHEHIERTAARLTASKWEHEAEECRPEPDPPIEVGSVWIDAEGGIVEVIGEMFGRHCMGYFLRGLHDASGPGLWIAENHLRARYARLPFRREEGN